MDIPKVLAQTSQEMYAACSRRNSFGCFSGWVEPLKVVIPKGACWDFSALHDVAVLNIYHEGSYRNLRLEKSNTWEADSNIRAYSQNGKNLPIMHAEALCRYVSDHWAHLGSWSDFRQNFPLEKVFQAHELYSQVDELANDVGPLKLELLWDNLTTFVLGSMGEKGFGVVGVRQDSQEKTYKVSWATGSSLASQNFLLVNPVPIFSGSRSEILVQVAELAEVTKRAASLPSPSMAYFTELWTSRRKVEGLDENALLKEVPAGVELDLI